MRSSVHTGHVMHGRSEPARNFFRYPTCFFRIDISELEALDAKLRLFRYGRGPSMVSLIDDEYMFSGGGAQGSTLVEGVLAWVSSRWQVALPPADQCRIELVTNLRVFGYVFNPISCWYIYDHSGESEVLRWVIAEVHNTFGDRHAYLLDLENAKSGARAGEWIVEHPKAMHVSPFMPMDLRYRFRVRKPGDDYFLGIDVFGGERPFVTTWSGTGREMTDRAIARAMIRYPLAPMLVTIRIHLQALKLWLRRVPVFKNPGKLKKGRA